MGMVRDRARLAWRTFWAGPEQVAVQAQPVEAQPLASVPISEALAVAPVQGEVVSVRESTIISPGGGMMIDQDDWQYRRLTGGGSQRVLKRELNPVTQQRALEISWYLFEHNPLAHRLITFMTDLILGEGVTVEAADERIAEVLNRTWNHRVNQFAERLPEFHNSLAMSGELILTVAVNPINGIPQFGFIDSAQVKHVHHQDDNVLVAEVIELKPDAPGGEGRKLKIVQEDPVTGLMTGEVFFLAINKLPNSLRGRPDLLPLADWLDLYDTYLFAEVERLQLLSSFVWDLQVDGADDKKLQEALKRIPNPKPGTVYAHNEKEQLNARTPDLKASDRSEAGRMLLRHIAGCYGFPLAWLGDTENTNNATIQGQNDVAAKTPTARQKTFKKFIEQLVTFAIQQAVGKNPSLFKEAVQSFKVNMPELSAKDISRVGQVLSSVAAAMDTAIANKTGSRKLGTRVLVATLKHLGVDEDVQALEAEIEDDRVDDEEKAADLQATMARQSAMGRPNPDDDDGGDEPAAPAGEV